MLSCGGLFAYFFYMAASGPRTSVYAGEEVPEEFNATMMKVGALEEGESVLFFYSEALADIRDGFYLVSDKKVAIYLKADGDDPLTIISFGNIVKAELNRDNSFLKRSQIRLTLADGKTVLFPVSSEFNGDEQFFKAIIDRAPNIDGDQ